MNVRVEVKVSDLNRALRELRDQSPRAVNRALNRTIAQAATVGGRELSREIGLPVRRVRENIKVIRSTFATLRAALEVRGFRIPLYQFRARQTRTGVSYRLPRGRGVVPSGFIATMRSGHVGAFVRRTKARLPIVELFGPSLPKAFLQESVKSALRKVAELNLAANLKHEVEFLLRRRNAA